MGRARFALALLALTATAADASPLPRRQAPAPTYGEARPIPASVTFCEATPEECAIDLSAPDRIALDQATWDRIVSVNKAVNDALFPMTDKAHWGVEDRWDLAADGAGDCEDYALLKRHRLAALGLPRRAMRVTVVINELREGHAVLTLLTDRGDLVLDNRNRAILPYRSTGYEYVKRERGDGPGWVFLREAPTREVPVATLAPDAR